MTMKPTTSASSSSSSGVACRLCILFLVFSRSWGAICRVYPVNTLLRTNSVDNIFETLTATKHKDSVLSFRDRISYECAFWTAEEGELDDFAVLRLSDKVIADNKNLLWQGDTFLYYEEDWLEPGIISTLDFSTLDQLRFLTLDEMLKMSTISRHTNRQRRLQYNTTNEPNDDSPAKGVVIAVRVSTADTEPEASIEAIDSAVFGNSSSFYSQTRDCSAGTELLRPYRDDETVIDVTVDGNISNYTFDTLFVAANQKLKEYLDINSTQNAAQFALFFVPSGLMDQDDRPNESPVSYTAYNNFKSVYLDVLINTTQAILHETG